MERRRAEWFNGGQQSRCARTTANYIEISLAMLFCGTFLILMTSLLNLIKTLYQVHGREAGNSGWHGDMRDVT